MHAVKRNSDYRASRILFMLQMEKYCTEISFIIKANNDACNFLNFDTFYCKKNNIWISVNPPDFSKFENLPASPPKSRTIPPIEYPQYLNVFIAKPGKIWEIFLFRREISKEVQKKEQDNAKMTQIANRFNYYIRNSKKFEGTVYLYTEKDISYPLLRTFDLMLRDHGNYLLLNLKYLDEKIKQYL